MNSQRIFLIGYMGSGKTTIGKLLAGKLGWLFVDMDDYIEEKYNRSVRTIFAEDGEDAFREIEYNCLREIALLDKVVVATGGGVPCFFDNIEFMNSRGATFYLSFAPEELAVRLEISGIEKRPLLKNRHGAELVNFVADGLALRDKYYKQAAFIVEGDDEEILEIIYNQVKN